MAGGRVKVFVSHSFDQADEGLIQSIVAFMRQRRFGLDVHSAQEAEPEPFGNKVAHWVDWADVTFGLFTHRYEDPVTGRRLPPPYVISECSYALGRYYDNDTKGVHGFVEKGIEYSDLGLPTANGAEFPPFTRDQFDAAASPEELSRFLLKLHDRYGTKTAARRPRPYKQRELIKTVEVYRSGTGVFKNTVTVQIVDAEPINARGIEHNLWVPVGRCRLPGLRNMGHTSLTQRRDRPVFSCSLISRNKRRMERPMNVTVLDQTEQNVKFRVLFPFPVKNNDVLQYQYVWGMPGIFCAFEEEFASPSEYNEVSVRPEHGRIGRALLRLKFERDTTAGISATLFSKEPFALYSLTQREDGILSEAPDPLPLVKQEAAWEVYHCDANDLDVAVVARWRPSSKMTVDADLQRAKFQNFEAEGRDKAFVVRSDTDRKVESA